MHFSLAIDVAADKRNYHLSLFTTSCTTSLNNNYRNIQKVQSFILLQIKSDSKLAQCVQINSIFSLITGLLKDGKHICEFVSLMSCSGKRHFLDQTLCTAGCPGPVSVPPSPSLLQEMTNNLLFMCKNATHISSGSFVCAFIQACLLYIALQQWQLY